MRDVQHYINGQFVLSSGERSLDIFNPYTGEVQARLVVATKTEVQKAVDAARDALPSWSERSLGKRSRVFFNFKRLLEENMEELATLLSSEHGKTIADSKGDITRGIEVIDFMCGLPHLIKGEHTDNGASNIDIYSIRQPLGVCAGITPFNFPAMIPMWMFGVATACGNTFILKPSEKDPSVPVRLAELFKEAGAPDGVLNVVLGDRETVNALIEHPDIQALSFVGSSDVAHHIYTQASAQGKRVQAMGGAKNHGVVMPDADIDSAVSQIIGAAYGSAGERCMAMPVVVPVGRDLHAALREKCIHAVRNLTVGPPTDPATDFGPLVTAAHYQRVADYIQMGIDEGADLLIDGRTYRHPANPNGFYMGPSLFDKVTPAMRSYREEIFGPVLQIVPVETFEEAIQLVSEHQYGNGASLFTSSGYFGREFARRVAAGMVGINIPLPVPLSYYSFGGWKRSAFAAANQYGMEGLRFWTRVKTVTQRWQTVDTTTDRFAMTTGS